MTHARGTRLSYDLVENALGLIGFVVFILCVVGLAAGVTWLVVRLSPSPSAKNKPEPSGDAAN
jgi:hypothetical protein